MNKSEFDIDRAKSLVEEISANLGALPEDSAKYAQLRAEVAACEARLGEMEALARGDWPGLFRGATPLLGGLVNVAVWIWMLVAMVVAVRQALDVREDRGARGGEAGYGLEKRRCG